MSLPLPPLALREALLRRLSIEPSGRPRPGARLLRHDRDEAALLLPYSGECLALRAMESEHAPALAALAARLQELRRAARGSQLSVLVVGGGAATREELRRARGPLLDGGPLTLFHLADDGRLSCDRWLTRGARSARPALEHAIRELRRAGEAAPALSPQELDALVARGPGDHVSAEEAGFWDAMASRRPSATWALAGVMVLVFGLETAWGGSEFSPTLHRMGANVRDRVLAGEVFRLFSAAFLHIGVAHLLVNLWALRVFGPFLERVLGGSRYVVLYALAALGGSLASIAAGRAGLSAGASGALWGLMAGGFALALRPRGLLPDRVARALRAQGWQPLAVNLAFSFTPGIDLMAHLGGGLAGGLLVAGGVLTAAGEPDPAGRGRALAGAGLGWRLLAGALACAMSASLAAALVVGRPWELRAPPLPLRPLALPGAGLSFDAPAGAALESQAGRDGQLSFAIGDLATDPVSVQVWVLPWSQGGLDAARAAEDLRTELDKDVPADARPEGPAQVVTLDGAPAAVARWRFARGFRVVNWGLLRDGRLLRLEIVRYEQASPAWQAYAEHAPHGLRARQR